METKLTVDQVNDIIQNMEDTKQGLEHKLQAAVTKISEQITKTDRLLEILRSYRQSITTEE